MPLSLAALQAGDPDRAESLCRLLPDDPGALFNLGWQALRHGRLREGLRGLEAGRVLKAWGYEGLVRVPLACDADDRLPDVADKKIILRLERGLGDNIIAARFAKPLAARGAQVTVTCDPRLMPLIARVHGVSAVASNLVAQEVYGDAWVPGQSAPLLLGYEFDTLPAHPYMSADPKYVKKWAPLIGRDPDTYRIGIRWRGLPKYEHEQQRAFPPAAMFALADIPGVAVYSLQRDEGSEMLPARSKVIDLGPHLQTWEDTAGVVANLDLVISSCTSVAHLAAAMGKPTWIVIPKVPYYIWTYPWEGETSPWYPSVRLFRQEVYGDWSAPLGRLAGEVEALREQVCAC